MGDEGGGGGDPTPRKRARTGDLKRAAEIVMVLSAMGEMRAGKEPTAVERALAAEARERLAGICAAELRPRDLVPREAVRAVVEDLGLNRSRDPMMGFRPAKMSIADKLLHTKKKMEEAKNFTSTPSVYSSQHPPVEAHGTLTSGTPKFHPDRQSPMTFSAGSFQSISPGVHISTKNSSALKQSHVTDAHIAASSKSSIIPVDKGSSFLAQSQAGAQHLRFDGRFNGQPYLTPAQVASEKASSNSLVQPPSTISVKSNQSNNVLHLTQSVSEGAFNVQTKDQLAGNQEANTEFHGAVANLPVGHQAAQTVMFVPAPSFFTTHEDISKSVLKLLQPKVFDHPNWNPPSAEYTNKPINCQVCKVSTSDIDSLLVCDACEKGTHLKCLQSFGNKDGIPKAEWHCPRCLVTSNGKPFPPKYGRVTRTAAPQKAPSSATATSTSSEKRPENVVSKVNQQKPVANGNSALPNLVHASTSATNCSGVNLDSKPSPSVSVQSGIKTQVENSPATTNNNSTDQTGGLCTNHQPEPKNSDKDVQTNGAVICNPHKSTLESLPDQKVESGQPCPENPQDTATKDAFQYQAPSVANEVPISLETSTNNLQEVTVPSTDESTEISKLQGESKLNIQSEDQSDDQDISQAPSKKPNIDVPSEQLELKISHKCGDSEAPMLASEDKSEVILSGALDNDGCMNGGEPSVESDAIHWLGDVLQVVDGKTYYQSCQINGISHKLQNHVLVSADNQKFLPSKLQSLWEDNKTRSKWALVSNFYFPGDLLYVASCPSTPENHEVYASIKENAIMANSICGSCEVMSMQNFKDEIDRRKNLQDAGSSLHPVFMCRWMYDESKATFQTISD